MAGANRPPVFFFGWSKHTTCLLLWLEQTDYLSSSVAAGANRPPIFLCGSWGKQTTCLPLWLLGQTDHLSSSVAGANRPPSSSVAGGIRPLNFVMVCGQTVKCRLFIFPSDKRHFNMTPALVSLSTEFNALTTILQTLAYKVWSFSCTLFQISVYIFYSQINHVNYCKY